MTDTIPMLRLDLAAALSLPGRADVVVIDDYREERELLTIVRYAGRSRTDGFHAFAVRDAQGHFSVRSDHELGLTEQNDRAAYFSPPEAGTAWPGHSSQ